MQKLVAICKREESSWGTSLEADERALSKSLESEKARVTLLFRIERKKLLSKALKRLEQKAGSDSKPTKQGAFAKLH